MGLIVQSLVFTLILLKITPQDKEGRKGVAVDHVT